MDKDRKARILFLGKELQPVALADQSITGIAGERSAPTKMSFAKGQNSVFDLDWANVSSKLNSLKSKSEALCLRGMFYANGDGSASPGLAAPDAYPGMVW